MAPIANPDQMSREECQRIYGDRCYGAHGSRTVASAAGRSRDLKTWRRADGMMVTEMNPIANPEDMSPAERRRVYRSRYGERAWTAPATRRHAYASAPSYAPAPTYASRPAPAVAAAPAPTPKVAMAAPPVTTAPTPVAVTKPPVAPMTPTDKLSAAVKVAATPGTSLSVPDALSKGQEAKVTLTLPQDLLAIIQREAAKLGLTKAARKAEVSATLTGEGYTITPPGKQTKPLVAGQAASFDWQVKPGAGPKAPLRAEVDGALTGAGKPQGFSIASLQQAIEAAVEDTKAKASGFKMPHFGLPKLSLDSLSWPGMPEIDVAGVKAKTGQVSAGFIALLLLVIAVIIARGASASRARSERRRKYRTMTDYGRNEMEATPEPAAEPVKDSFSFDHQPAPAAEPAHHDDHGYVNPMIAAAAGAAAGAAAMHHHDEHATKPTHDDHAHAVADDHGHAPAAEAHAPAHDDHGHDGHAVVDDHGHAPAAEAHAPAHDDHGHDGHAAAEDHGHAVVDNHGHAPAAHDDHGHAVAEVVSHDDHGHAVEDHAHDDHGDAAAEDHGHDAHGHDDHGHAADTHAPAAHDDHGHDDHGHDDHGHDDHGHAAAAHDHAPVAHDDHGHDDHGHDEPTPHYAVATPAHDDHGHDHHAREPEHA